VRAAVTEGFGSVERLVVREVEKSGHARGKIVVRP
jgi:hypothetical protein